jgi:hypothetical protein
MTNPCKHEAKLYVQITHVQMQWTTAIETLYVEAVTAGLTQSAHGADDDANSNEYYKYVPTLISVTDIN